MRNGQRGQAEIIFFKLVFILKTLYSFGPLRIFFKASHRLRSPTLNRQVRVGSRKYTLITPASLDLQVSQASYNLLAAVSKRPPDGFIYTAIDVWLDLSLDNRFSTQALARRASDAFVLTKAGVVSRHLHHYRWA
jgi:hypothetical protein